MCCCAWQSQIFLKKYFCPKNGENGQKIKFLKFIGKYSLFFLDLVYNESLYYLLYSCTNPIFGKSLVPKICAKMLLANQITGLLNQLISLEQNDAKAWFFACWYRFMEIKSWLKNIGVGMVKKWVWPLCSQDSKIGCISRRSEWNEFIFGVLIQMQES